MNTITQELVTVDFTDVDAGLAPIYRVVNQTLSKAQGLISMLCVGCLDELEIEYDRLNAGMAKSIAVVATKRITQQIIEEVSNEFKLYGFEQIEEETIEQRRMKILNLIENGQLDEDSALAASMSIFLENMLQGAEATIISSCFECLDQLEANNEFSKESALQNMIAVIDTEMRKLAGFIRDTFREEYPKQELLHA
jgi:hypothetical protein